DQWHVAAPAAHHIATVSAVHAGGRAAPVDEEDRLLASLDRRRQRLLEPTAEDTGVAGPKLLAEIDHVNPGQRSAASSLVTAGQRQDGQFATFGSPGGRYIGSGARQDDRDVGQSPQLERNLAGVVARRVLLLVGCLVLLVEHDQAELRGWREEGRARP